MMGWHRVRCFAVHGVAAAAAAVAVVAAAAAPPRVAKRTAASLQLAPQSYLRVKAWSLLRQLAKYAGRAGSHDEHWRAINASCSVNDHKQYIPSLSAVFAQGASWCRAAHAELLHCKLCRCLQEPLTEEAEAVAAHQALGGAGRMLDCNLLKLNESKGQVSQLDNSLHAARAPIGAIVSVARISKCV